MPGSFVRSWEDEGISGTGTLSIPDATPNNLLVVFTLGREADDATVDPKWTLIAEGSRSANPYAYTGVWFKIADGDDDFVATYNWASTLWTVQAVEYQGLSSDQGSVLDSSNSNNQFGLATLTSIFTNTATPSQTNGFSVVGVSVVDQAGWNGSINHPGTTVDSGYTARTGQDHSNVNGPSVRFADKVYADLLGKDATWSTTGSGNRNFAFVANFKEPTVGGPVTATGTGNAQSATGSGNVTAFATVTATGSVTAQNATGTGNVSVPAAFPTAELTLTDPAGTPLQNLTGLRWAWFDQATPDLFVAPTDKGTGETTDGAGLLSIELPNTTLVPGQIGWLDVTDSDGTTTQNPAHKAFSGPVEVS